MQDNTTPDFPQEAIRKVLKPPEPTYSLLNLESFGDVAAEDDAVLDYFVTTDATTRLQSGQTFLVLGRKGSGKTALVRYFAEGTNKSVTKALNLRGYPWSIHAARIDKGASDIEAYVSSWRYLLALEIAMLAYRAAGSPSDTTSKALVKFLTDNYGGPSPDLGDVLRPTNLRFSDASLEPQVLGNKLGSISFSREEKDLGLGTELNALSDLLLSSAQTISATANLQALYLQIDELDQGLSIMDPQRVQMITGLILATREIHRLMKNARVPVRPAVYLRTDLWDDISFSDKNKITETSALVLEWTVDSLLNLINARLRAKLPPDATWEKITTPSAMRGSQTKWNHITSRTFLRPRDVIKFLNSALAEAKKRGGSPLHLDNQDVTSARANYSAYLKSELDDELLTHWAQWGQALQACSSLSTITFRRDDFVREYEKLKTPENSFTADAALKTLFNFSVIGYERRSGYGGQFWVFRYTNPQAGWDNAAAVFKVHPGLKEYAKLREERSSTEADEAAA